jgi:hypothetical protein
MTSADASPIGARLRRRARQHVIDHDGGDGGDEAERACKQRLRDAGRHDREICGVRLRDADEAIHDAPDRSEQADERRGGGGPWGRPENDGTSVTRYGLIFPTFRDAFLRRSQKRGLLPLDLSALARTSKNRDDGLSGEVLE